MTFAPASSRFPYRHLLLIVLLAAAARALLLASGSVTFHADEAVVALMARHITQGARPVFFYGQAYMGSLDAWAVAFGFQLLGESVQTIRLVQGGLYLLVVATGYLAAWRLSRRPVVAAAAGLALAVPTVNVALYTSATLGGYNELLLLGHLVLLFGYEVSHTHPRSRWRWALLGLCAGVGWWTHGLIVIYALPVAALVVYRTLIRPAAARGAAPLHRAAFMVLALLAFIIGSAPWWVFDIQHNGAAISTFLTNRQSGEFAGIGLPYVPPAQRALGLLLIGLPTLIGLRFPWQADYFLPPVGALVVLVYGLALYRLLRIPDRRIPPPDASQERERQQVSALQPDARALLLGIFALFGLIFIASSFGADPTGRYFLPLALPLGIVLGTLADGFVSAARPDSHGGSKAVDLRAARTSYSMFWLPLILVALVIGYQAAGQIAAATTPPGFTTQFDPVSHLSNDHDAELIAFLEAHDLYHGYTNYWVAFRLAFLSGERLQYSAALPYKTTLDYNAADNRYPPYAAATAQADRVAYITTNLPELNHRLETAFEQGGITYQRDQIGAFTIYYDFGPHHPAPLKFP